MKFQIIFIFTVLFGSCFNKKVSNSTKLNPVDQLTSIPQELMLKSRITNCDSAKVYMKNIIHPIRAVPSKDLLHPVEKQAFIIIPGENNTMYKDNYYLIHINTDCFLNSPFDEIINIFCPPDSMKDFEEVNKKYQEKGIKWFLSVRASNGFGLGFWVENGMVISASIDGGTARQ